MEFSYSNVNERPRGPLLTAAGLVVRGIPRVQAQALPYAEAWRRDNLAALAGTGPLWVALGDSLTQGIGAPAHDRGWVGQLRARRRPDHRVVNLAVSGARTADVLERQLPVLESLPRPDLVTLMIGSNDLMRPRYRRELVGHVDALLHRLPVGALVTTLPNPSRVAAEVNRVIARVAAERGLVVAELRDPRTSSWRGRLAADHFHPNEAGYAALAEVIGDALPD
ncbi:Lysophospholipase L1 [Jatrophihabitans endophyticus]|uniref:Lysophospholipase L1 n=1 Tax=Jatrophihabitans endophyticus TaxID=1206085 RepID=A0A1M5PCW3_9ACTN|nr:SGNH/GDSL hydrolase family protein [Jatrophihabitans endophyticus]SHG99626.1 Lysophospholipase L1 [Jatrophihabitans endophyticus]